MRHRLPTDACSRQHARLIERRAPLTPPCAAAWLGAVTALALAGCVADIDTSGPPPEQQTLASIEVDGAEVRFEQLAGGQLALVVLRQPEQSTILDRPELLELTPSEKYELWTGRSAPAALLSAEAAAMEASDAIAYDAELFGGAEPAPEVAAARQVASTAAALTPDEFRSAFCRGVLVNAICPTDVHGNGSWWWRAFQLWGYVNADRGNVELELRLDRAVGGWQSRGRWTVQEGEVLEYELRWNGVAARPLGVRVNKADDGDRYHILAKHLPP